jgi:hypothetical protein
MAIDQAQTPTLQSPVFLRRIGLVLMLVVGAALALSAWLLLGEGENGSPNDRGEPVAISVGGLKALTGSVGHAVYWAGTKPSVTYELTRTHRGDIYIRYLPPGVSLGDKRPKFLTVGTYPKANAFRTVQRAATQKGEIVHRIADGGLAVAHPQSPQSVYFAYPGSNLLVEVYDPSRKRALRAVVSGQVQPVQ